MLSGKLLFKKLSTLGLIVIFIFLISGTANAQTCPDGMVSYWKLDETSGPPYADYMLINDGHCPDTCPTPATGIINGDPGDGIKKAAQAFDGTAGIDVPDPTSLNWDNTDSFSLELWINTTQIASGGDDDRMFIGRYNSEMTWWLGYDGTRRIKFSVTDSDSIKHEITGLTVVNDGKWHHIAAVRDADNEQLLVYVDGQTDNSPVSATFTGDFIDTSPLTIGYYNNSHHYEGLLDEIALSNRALPETEIKTHYNASYYLGRGYCDICSYSLNIMPLGNSITAGMDSGAEPSGGDPFDPQYWISYRLDLYENLIAAGYEFDFVGSLIAGDSYFSDYNHEGHGGKADDWIATNVYGFLYNNPADVVLLHIGTNNLNPSPADVDNILDEIDQYEADSGTTVTVILARIINRRNHVCPNISGTTTFNDNVQTMAEARIANGDKIIMVDMECGAGIDYSEQPAGDMWDNLHPYATGYAKMAAQWFNKLDDFLPVCILQPTFPTIISTPVTRMNIGQLYTYNVIATGNPHPTYALNTFPNGMTINPTTGLINWTPTTGQEGPNPVEVKAINSEGTDTQNFTVNVVTVQYSWNMDTDPGWSTEGLWAWGQPTGGGGQYGNPDPISGYTGNTVCGYNLSGDYENNLPETHLTSTAINCMGLSEVTLKFKRWLGVEQPRYDHAYLRVSNDGTNWTTIWENTAVVTDSSWTSQEFDISSIADYEATVYVRWTTGNTDGSWQYCGWNIDDVEIWGIGEVEPSCDDGLLNQDEDLIDCGGSSCPACDCTEDAPCLDELFCNGAETCNVYGNCQPGIDPCPQGCDEVNDECIGPAVQYSWNMDTDPGWITEGLWAFGQPTGGGGQYGSPDPISGYTGNTVYGYNLEGDYENNLPETHLTSTAINCTGLTGVTLKFKRWLGVEQPRYDHAYLRVSNDGTNWTTIWENTAVVTDSSWTSQEFDISSIADYEATVYVRWTTGNTDGSWQYCGWNIDDVEIWGIGEVEPTCDDGILNQDEVRIDCGGSSCPTCDCLIDDNCADELFCNGAETCNVYGNCQPGTDPCPQGCDDVNDECIGPAVQYSWNMNTDPGWDTEGLWAWGQPTGGGGQYGNPDPISGYTGNTVYGYNLEGDYENYLPETHLTSMAINCTGLSDVTLKFKRWLGVEQPAYDHAYVRVSNDGTNWTTIWENTAMFTDSSWTSQEFDISSVADYEATVYVRWTTGNTDGSWQYCGWNIDDVEIWGIGEVLPTCDDGLLNQDEDLIDCGGSSCPACDCLIDDNCADGLFCNGVETCDVYGNCQLGIDPCPQGCDEVNDECTGPAVQYSWNMDTDPGWSTEGLWAWGQPTGGGGQYGNPDPISGYTGNTVCGYNLSGDYENNLPETHLTSTAINCMGLSEVTLKFKRWLGVEQPRYDHAYLRVSNDGTNWTTIWENTAVVTDSSWTSQEFDISSVADNQATVYVRWTIGTSDGSWQYCGWNIDDVEIWGEV